MAELSRLDKIKLERVFDMGGGFVLDFTNRTFEEFFLEKYQIEIYNKKYENEYSGSKANRIREFWNKENNYIVGKSIIEILDYSKAIGYSYQHPTETISEELIEQCYKIGYRLRDETGIAEIDAIKPIEDTRDYKLLSESIKNHILKDQPEAGLDRLHTYLVGYIRSLCEKHEIEYEKKESLNAIFGKYVKNLVKLEKIESEMTVKILKFSISILDSFNYIRNNKSLAHDNEKIAEYSESILIFNNINSLVKFIQVIEERFDNERKMNEPIIEEEDNLPF
jgi:hypothetical protein